MLENMFVGRPPGNYDRLLDFSRAVTGSLFFVPSATFLENVTADQTNEDHTNEDHANEAPPGMADSAPAGVEPSPSIPSVREGSLAIGSLKGDPRHE
jgi:putative iron-dependent peroxidase